MDTIASFLSDHAVILVLFVSGAWLYSAFDYSRKGNLTGTFGWGAVAVLILCGFCIHELFSAQRSWGNALLASIGIACEIALIRKWMHWTKR